MRPAATRPRPWMLASAAIVILAIVAALLLHRGGGAQPQRAAALPPLATAVALAGFSTADVQQVSGTTLLLRTAAGSRSEQLPPAVPVEALTPETAAQIRPGDWLSVGAVDNLVRPFAIKQIVDIQPTQAAASAGAGVPRSRAGFTGFEGAADARIAPSLYGRVSSITASLLTLTSPAGTATLNLAPTTPIVRLASSNAGTVRDGDRLVMLGSDQLAKARAVLVRPPP